MQVGHAQGLGYSVGDFRQGQFHADAQVGASSLARTPAATASETGSSTETTERASEIEASEAGPAQDFFQVDSLGGETTASESGMLSHGVAVLVVELAFLIVAENIVCFRGLFEFFLSFFVAGVAVGMVLESLFAIGFLYFFRSSTPVHAEHFVIVAFGVHIRGIILLQPLWRGGVLCR